MRAGAPSFVARFSLALAVSGLLAAGLLAIRGPDIAPAPSSQFILHARPEALPAVSFRDADGSARSLADFRGRVVLLNLWAPWCPPCRREMPALDRLQQALGGADFEVVAVSASDAAAARKLYRSGGIAALRLFTDASDTLMHAFAAAGLPLTVLIDRDGREIGRHLGAADWDAPQVASFLRACIASRHGCVADDGRTPAGAAPPRILP